MAPFPFLTTACVALISGGVAVAGAPAAWRVPRRGPGVDQGRPSVYPPGRPNVGALIVIFLAGLVGAGAVTARVGWRSALAGLLVAVVGGIWLAVVDLRVRRLPAVAVLMITAAAGVLLGLAACVDGEKARLLAVVAGAVGMRLAYRVNQAVVGGMGAGDLRMAYLLGGVGGWAGWPGWMAAAVLPFALSALAGGLLLVLGHRRRNEPVPFGPAIVIGMIAALLVADQ